MQVICRARKTGRTTALIEMCTDAEARGETSYIVCESNMRASYISQKAKEMNLNIRFPITFDDFLSRRAGFGMYIHQLFIDDADRLIQYISPIVIAAIVVERDASND